ncbi:DUF1080 domain-containing protein [Blastopirellula sp. JC732]|uniref:DUF1080 domain-containing protein n=1 Tax=Blastopirellula sediminis TaxID=2894196 RepID=A0A9X1SIB0_9BACT|nr:DUF1080 domain-containing protein [Blastopirellula sediminis]MCC9605307.1 DUF1080 domain-containing protein [Blastopirellula sediminis]MCC9631393.1 DUF1080 domain-containing protein [Blastopirellula sediminis]
MSRFCFALPLVMFLAASLSAADAVSLFDGKTLDGWEGKAEWFRVEDGAIVAGSLEKSIPNNEFLCTKEEYGDFELTLEAKLVGQGTNAGIQFRSQRIPNHHEMIGFQCDIGSSPSRVIWGSLYDESRRKVFMAEGPADEVAKVVKKGEWNQLKVRCVGPKIQIWVNGLQTVDYTEGDDAIPRTGIIGLQIHSGPAAEASYRNLQLKKL